MEKLLGKAMPLGCLMIDVEGLVLTQQDKQRLLNPAVAGVILFSRHYQSVEQLQVLTNEIHQLRHPKLLIAVDHEGGRVQRFREGFTRLPAMGELGKLYHSNQKEALELAQTVGWLLATELLAVGVDFSFAPVVDLDYGDSRVIGDRSFDASELIVANLSAKLMSGMHKAGMACVAKHFPGHGFIEQDTHKEIAIDERSFNQISRKDIQPFLKLIENRIEAVMPAHVIYPKIDDKPAGFSKKWLQDILRGQCHFDGAIISDDMSMQAAVLFGSPLNRVTEALDAGCDLILLCNDLEMVSEVLSSLNLENNILSHTRLIRLHGKPTLKQQYLHSNPLWQAASFKVNAFMHTIKQQDIPL